MGEIIIARNQKVENKIDISYATVTLDSTPLVYDGTVKTKTVTSVTYGGQTLIENTDYVVVNNAYTNAGNYTLSVQGIGNYEGQNNVNWSIAKATGSISVNPSSMSIQGVNETSTATITKTGDGTVSVSSSDTSIATVSVSGTTVTMTSIAAGSATITVTLGTGNNYLGASATISVSVVTTHIYGVSWNGTSTTSWSRTDDAALFTDPVPYISGATNYSSPFDDKMPWSGMTIVEDSEAGTMVQIPKFWYKLTPNGSTDSAGFKIQIADNAVDGFSVSPAHMDRGDGKGERDVVYIGRYHVGSWDYKSTSGQKPKVNITRSTARTQIHNLGSTIWQADWAMRFTIWLLYIVEFANWNSQDKIGYGCGNDSAMQAMGASDSMPYHTGTMRTSRTTYGVGVQYRWIEGLWDNCYDWLDGCYNSSSGLMLILNPSNFSDSANGISVGTPSSGNPSAFSVKSVNGTFPLFISSASDGSNSTYSCDYWNFSASGPCVYAGGYYSQNLKYGLFCFYFTSVSIDSAIIGSRSMKLP